MNDEIENPKHYTSHPSGVECIEIAGYFPFAIGSAIKYIWRRGQKDDEIQDLKKAIRFLQLHQLHSLPKVRRRQVELIDPVKLERVRAGLPYTLRMALDSIVLGPASYAVYWIEEEIKRIEAEKKPIEIEPPTEEVEGAKEFSAYINTGTVGDPVWSEIRLILGKNKH